MKITYITGNKAKIDLAKQFLGPLGIEIDNKKIECPEIQADTFEEVAKFSSKYASDTLKCDVLKNDSGLVIESLNGFPGVYTHYIEDTIGEDGILKLMEGKENGILVPVKDTDAMAKAMEQLLTDEELWKKCSTPMSPLYSFPPACCLEYRHDG